MKEGSNIKYNKFICDFYRKLDKRRMINSNIVFLCIGTDRITGDCFGPIVGNKLQRNNVKNLNIKVYGTLQETVNASNLNNKIKDIFSNCKNPYIVAIDAALSNKESVGKIIVSNHFLQAGIGIGKESINIGDISIRAIIGKREKIDSRNMEVLQNTSLNMVINLANLVSKGVIEVLQENNF